MSTYRAERDSLGTVNVPADALYGINTARALENFAVSGVLLGDLPEFLTAYAQVKIAAVRTCSDLGLIPAPIAEAIVAAGREVADGMWLDHFPLPIVQGGGGTSTNMNMNEVLANRASQLLGLHAGSYDVVHPNDHVNCAQSTNDTYPTALQIATIVLGREAISHFDHVRQTLVDKGHDYPDLNRLGRTCLRDALPLPIAEGQLAQADALRRTTSDLDSALTQLTSVPLGATAIGTGLGAPPGYRDLAVDYLAQQTGLDLGPARNPFDSLAHLDPFLSVALHLVRIMLVLGKVAADLRFLSSGPIGGIGEVSLPPVQAGSSQMPGKVNPVMPELVLQVSFEARGTLTIVETATAAGELELNVMEPVVTRHLLGSLRESGRAARLFADRCLRDLSWNEETVRRHLDGSLAQAVNTASEIGYQAATEAQ